MQRQLIIALILYFPPSVQASPSLLVCVEGMSLWGSFPLLAFGPSKATEAPLYLWRAGSSNWGSRAWSSACNRVVLVQASGVRAFSCTSGTKGGICFRRTLARGKGGVLDVWARWWTVQDDLKLSPVVWSVLAFLISPLAGLVAAAWVLLFFFLH